MIQLYDLTTNHLENPMGIDSPFPRFSWKMMSKKRNTMQKAYQLQAANDEQFTDILWDTQKKCSEQSIAVQWEGPKLQSRQRVYWRVKVWSETEESKYSEVQYFEMGLLNESDWIGKWIEMETEVDPNAYQQEPIIRKSFCVDKGLTCARIYATAHGAYTFYINGVAGTTDLFLPGRTAYYDHLPYQTYDITSLLTEGENVLAIMMGDGWWRGANTAQGIHNLFGEKLAFLGQIELEYADGEREMIGSDNSFRYIAGPLLKSDTKTGEIFDAAQEPKGWKCAGFDDSGWNFAYEMEYAMCNLEGTTSVPVRAMEKFHPQILHTPDGHAVLDFGQNIAGFVSFTVEAPKGTEIRMTHSEVLDLAGNFTVSHYMGYFGMFCGREETFQEEVYITSGEGIETFSPMFVVYGFRYVLLEGYPENIKAENFTAHAVYSAMKETGKFTCSETRINQLVKNSMWSQKGNFLEVPTDCPTRERSAWSGDAQVYCKTACDFMDTYAFYEKWMRDVSADQTPDGRIRNISPQGRIYNKEEAVRMAMRQGIQDEAEARKKVNAEYDMGDTLDGSAGWGDVAVILPWTIYQVYGDIKILENQYDSAKKWVTYMLKNAERENPYYKGRLWYQQGQEDGRYIWDTCFHWGEWLEPDSADNDSGDGDGQNFFQIVETQMTMGEPVVATAYMANSVHLLSEMAEVLGKNEDARYYAEQYQKIRDAYMKYFVNKDGSIWNKKGENKQQAPLARTLAFGLADEEILPKIAAKLNEYVIAADYHLNTGFLSTRFLLPMLAEYGYEESAYKILMQQEYPSWLFHVNHGATTICESWACYMPGKEPFASCNHYSYGAVCDFMFSYIAGIKPGDIAYKQVVLEPVAGENLQWAEAEYESPYGTISSRWERKEDTVSYRFEVPANTTAFIRLKVSETRYEQIKQQYQNCSYGNGKVCICVGSGCYEF